MNLCTDLLVAALVPAERIAALSVTAADGQYSPIADQVAAGIKTHSGNAEEVIALQPDLVIAPSYAFGAVQLLERLGQPVERVALGYRLDSIPKMLREIGALVSEPARASEVIAEFEAARTAASSGGRQGLAALVVGANGYTAGRESLKGDVMAAAGFANASERLGITGAVNLDIESLIQTQPDLLVIDDSTVNKDSLAQAILRHPALRALPAVKQIQVDPAQWLCASPHVSQIWHQLANITEGAAKDAAKGAAL